MKNEKDKRDGHEQSKKLPANHSSSLWPAERKKESNMRLYYSMKKNKSQP